MNHRLILASSSKTRHAMLKNAGVDCDAIASMIDEEGYKQSMKAEGANAAEAAETLAEMKALRMYRQQPDGIVIAADQMLECNGIWFDKPKDRDNTRAQLLALRGKTHQLVSAAVIYKEGSRIWGTIDTAHLTMRNFTEEWLDWYLDAAGEDIFDCVGGYQLEGIGAQLFTEVRGDYFTVLGLPLLPLIGFLRDHGVLKA
ncbi:MULTISPECIES: Maf family protein [Thalassospira]|uniref:Nucleoside triphosphate pyrophosphatase n=1 Tax=Thalassospira lucentensis TaxID=168935 RepID=A0A358HT80_9PROT|nr:MULTISPECIES: Maf family protein [Thalassospira]MBV18130.1 septum formation protein Maf [Thalassospira sp.]RCK19715.1 septum formation protein Maf [Thalassospira lucentensis MCCC 1A00383 = DSM 14000]HBU98368.1 Maf-like protein [Thalassospira lucentensis]HCW66348.1 Maf-like protein [Thalassospira lucentensis]|tara:strand:+ start:82525 stop:83124 length:600 start_codon:yes stop_codon:yes gene_type:complete